MKFIRSLILAAEMCQWAFVACAVALLADSRPARATTITLSGADLLTYPGVSFPSYAPTQTGSALYWGTSGSNFAKLFELSLPPVALTDVVGVKMNLTRLTTDFDPHIMLSDGANIVGAVIGDDNGGEFREERFVDSGSSGTRDGADGSGFFGFGYPAVGESFDVNVGFRFTANSTTVSAAFENGSAEQTATSRYLTPSNGLRLDLMRDNDSVEQYQLNSLTVTVVPEPNSALTVVGLFALGLIVRVRSQPSKNPAA